MPVAIRERFVRNELGESPPVFKLGPSRFSCLYLQLDADSGRLEYCNLGYPPGFFYMSSRDELFAMTGREAGLGREAVGRRRSPVDYACQR